MSVGRTVKNRTRDIKGRISEALGRVSRHRRLERTGKAERVSGRLGPAGEKLIRERYSLDVLIPRMTAFYESVAEGARTE